MSKPFIIWTLQRTGGTNLARRLFENSHLLEDAKEKNPGHALLADIYTYWELHEPFNYGKKVRAFGPVTVEWVERRDIDKLNQSMDEICSMGLPIKHCVEMLPWEVTEALLRASCRHGYRHIFLYRKKVVNRLLSLHFANSSGIWGPELKNQKELTDKIFSEPLPVAKLVEHENRCSHRLQKAWDLLSKLDAEPYGLAFEDAYEVNDPSEALQLLLPVLSYLDMSGTPENDATFINEIIGGGDQGTKNAYSSFKGIPFLEKELSKIRTFSLTTGNREVLVKNLCAKNPGVRFALLDNLPGIMNGDQPFDLGGVVVLNDQSPQGHSLRLLSDDGEQEIPWNISSPGMAKRFPQSPNGGQARFRIGNIRFPASGRLQINLCEPGKEDIPVFGLHDVEMNAGAV